MSKNNVKNNNVKSNKKIKFRELLNPFILNDKWIGGGDLEYFDENGEVRMRSWIFHMILDPKNVQVKEYFTLDDKIDASEFLNQTQWVVKMTRDYFT